MAFAKWTIPPFADPATKRHNFVLDEQLRGDRFAFSLAVVPAELVTIFHLPTLPKLHRGGSQSAIWDPEVISGVPIVVATQATNVLRKAAGDGYCQISVPIIRDPQREVSLDNGRVPALVDPQFSFVQGHRQLRALIIHLVKQRCYC